VAVTGGMASAVIDSGDSAKDDGLCTAVARRSSLFIDCSPGQVCRVAVSAAVFTLMFGRHQSFVMSPVPTSSLLL